MKIKQTFARLLMGTFLVIGLTVATGITFASPSTASAECDRNTSKCCGGVQTSIIQCTQDGGANAKAEQTGLWGVLLLVINILTAGVGVAAIGGIVYGSILYTSAGGSPEQVKKAIGIITNVVIGVIAYALMFSLLNFIIPGGLFTNATP